MKGYDYSQAGAYFITICTQNRECLFGDVTDGRMVANDVGRMIERWWGKLSNKFSFAKNDEYMVMPNHFHGIVIIVGADLCVCPDPRCAQCEPGAHTGAPLPAIVQWFKTMTTNEYICCVKRHGWQPFAGRLWQRNYYEHIIRDDDELNRAREYITNNPAQWELDRENPDYR
ncbi:MAG: hypothetical protein PHT33_05760 [bacterium]|nr:hypothetical protein [bacterium]